MSIRFNTVVFTATVACLLAIGQTGCERQTARVVESAPAPATSETVPATVGPASTRAATGAPSPLPKGTEQSGYQAAGAPYGCTEDCSGHDAGYEWAETNAISEPDECSGNSESFIEGCRTYAAEQSGEDE